MELSAEVQNNLIEVMKAEENGFTEAALQAMDVILNAYPQYHNELLYEKALMEFRNGRDFEALKDFISLYQAGGAEDILSLIFEAYIEPNEERFSARYAENRDRLLNYKYFFGEIEEQKDTYIAWADEMHVIFFDEAAKNFVICENTVTIEADYTEESVLLYNPMFEKFILEYDKACTTTWSMNGRTIPIYLDFDRNYLEAFLQTVDMEELLTLKRLVYFTGDEAFERFFHLPMSICPETMIGVSTGWHRHKDILTQIFDMKNEKYRKDTEHAEAYYRSHGQEIIERIRERKCSILFLTSRFTNTLKYHTRNCADAALKLGMNVKVLMEEDDIFHNDFYAVMDEIASYKPDILFMVDHLRFEYDFPDLEHMVLVSWIQDLLPAIMDPGSCGKLKDRDILMTHIISHSGLTELYKGRKMISAPIPANEDIYKLYVISDEEHAKYDCDICLVCHASDAEHHIEKFGDRFDPDTKRLILHIYSEYLNTAYRGEFLFSEDEFLRFIKKVLAQDFQIELEDEMIAFVAEDMYRDFNLKVFRQVMVDWILEAGFENIKLWGNGWLKSSKYARYAMGPAKNGEELSKICQCSKIVLGNNVMTTAAARAWETMLSGGFYMSNYIPPEQDVCDIRKILNPEDFVMFYDKKDLIEKLHFYLEHKEERQHMIERERKVSLEKMTFKRLMERVMDEIPILLEEQRKD